MNIKTLCHGGIVTETKQEDRNGVKVGIIEGYGATWDVDRGGWDGVKDQFVRGAFTKAIQRHKEAKRQVRFKDHHGRTIGGIPIESVKEDARGVFISAEVNLEMQQGKDAFSLAKQGVLTDFSIGWGLGEGSTIKDGVRVIPESEMWEFSIVDEPMNPKANITAVKAIDFNELDAEDMRSIEEALTSGVKFSNKTAKKIVHLMKDAGMLRDELDGNQDSELMAGLDKILKQLKEH